MRPLIARFVDDRQARKYWLVSFRKISGRPQRSVKPGSFTVLVVSK